MSPASILAADQAWPLWDAEPVDGAFQFDQSGNSSDQAVVIEVSRPWLFGYKPTTAKSNGRGILILGGGGYIQLMVGREGVAVARWLASRGFYAFVLVHRFPTAESSPQAPLDDAWRALEIITKSGLVTAEDGLGVCGLSSGGHLAAALLADYPVSWTPISMEPRSKPSFAIIGYGPVSTNAVGRTIVPNKVALEPPAKQALYDAVQPDVQLVNPAPPTFIVYSGNDPIVPVVNAYRLAEGLTSAGGAVELHVFADAPHGFALDTKGIPVARWPELCEAWMKQIGVLEASE
jgi:acetyl esterase/lipase